MQCIYCGTYDNLTKDHAPPKCLFRRPFPKNMKTVPSCATCNNGFSKDEEYFRLIIIGLLCHVEEANEVFNGSISRSMDRNQKMEDLMFGSLQVIDGKVVLNIDYSRIFRIAEKIARGLEFLNTGVVLDKKQDFYVSFAETIQNDNTPLNASTNFSYRKIDNTWEFTLFSSVCFHVTIA